MPKSEKSPWKDEDILREEYVDKEKSMAEVADTFGVSVGTVDYWIDKFGIQTRTISEANSDGDIMKLRDENFLEGEYITEGKSTIEIGRDLNVDPSIVGDWLKRHDIPTRKSNQEKSDANRDLLSDESFLREKYKEEELTQYEIADLCECTIDNVRYWLEKHSIKIRSLSESFTDGDVERLKDSDTLYEMYWTQEMSLSEIASELDVAPDSVRDNMVRFGIDRRPDGPRSGEHHPNFKGDLPCHAQYYGANWTEQRNKVLIQDQARCQRCGMNEKEHYAGRNQSLHVHHIINKREYINSNGVLDFESANKPSNLIPLCFKCHRKLEGMPIDNRQM